MADNKIVKLGLEEDAHRLKKEGCSDPKIAAELSELAGKKISRSTVYRFFEDHKALVKEVVTKSEALAVIAVKRQLDLIETILENIEKTDGALTQAVEAKAWGAAVKLLTERRMNVETAAKIMGMIKDPGMKVNINNAMNQSQGVTLSDDELERKARQILNRRKGNTN